MRGKKLLAAGLAVLLLAGSGAVPAHALDSGVYTGSVVTSYYNPDTGNVDDGGTANAALGEGMCRSATAETALVEVDASGNTWVTIRLLLQSDCKNVALYTRTGYDTYSQASYTVTAENAADDSIDYRFKVSSAGVKLKATMYVTPMGRDVLWYLYVDTSTLKSGSGDFEVTIDTSAAAAGSAASSGASGSTTASQPKTSAAGQSQTASKPSSGSAAGTTAAGTTAPTDTTAQTPTKTTETTEGTETAETPTDAAQTPEEEKIEDTQTAEDVDGEEPSSTDEETASTESGGSGPVIGVIVVIVAAVCAAIYLGKKKKTGKG